MNEPLDYLAYRNKERKEKWREKFKEHTETKHGQWVEWQHGDEYDEPTALRMAGAI